MAVDYTKLLALLDWAQKALPQLVPIIQGLIDIFKTSPQPFNVAKSAKGDCRGGEMLDALHASVYHQSEALAQTLLAMHAAACCCDQAV